MDWLGMVVSFISMWLLSGKKRQGWIFYVASSLLWTGYGFYIRSIPVIVMDIVLCVMGIRGYLIWKDESKEIDYDFVPSGAKGPKVLAHVTFVEGGKAPVRLVGGEEVLHERDEDDDV
jgi:hypothetical protein